MYVQKGRLVVWTETPSKATDNGIADLVRPSRFSRSGDLARIRAQDMADSLMHHLTLGVGSPGFKNNKDHEIWMQLLVTIYHRILRKDELIVHEDRNLSKRPNVFQFH